MYPVSSLEMTCAPFCVQLSATVDHLCSHDLVCVMLT